MSSNATIQALQPLRKYIRQNISHIRSSPCILITSSPPPEASANRTTTPHASTSSSPSPSPSPAKQEQLVQQNIHNHYHDPRIHSFVQRNTQSLINEFNLRTVPCTISSAFPTAQNVKEAVTLAKRAGLKEGRSGGESAGEGIVIGIGSGPAMDLAKAVADSLFGNNIRSANNDYDDDTHNEGGKLILAPSSMGGLWAASSNSPSLLLDTEEEMLMPHLTSSWRMESSGRRAGTVVALDQSRYLAMPPLYSGPKSLSIKNLHIISSGPSMAHVAGALLSIVLDAARSLDATSSNNAERESGSNDVVKEMKVVASLCASVLHLAVDEATNNGSDDNADDGIDSPVSANHTLAQQHLLDAIPRLSLIIEQSSSLLNQSQHSIITHGTIPQTLANALLPSYFPQCHLVTYLACILPGFCDVLAASGPRTSHSNGEERILSALEEVAHSIINCTTETENNNRDSNKSSEGLSEQLSHWASEITVEAGIPTMASLAFGTPDLNSLVGSLDAHDAFMASLYGGNAGKIGGGDDTRWIVEDVLQRSLNR